jgi:cobalt/nickel transport system permease protein
VRHEFLDRYGALSSPIHKIDARAKLVGFFAALLIVVSEPTLDASAFALYFALIGLIILISRIPIGFLARRCLIAGPFIFLAGALIFLVGRGGSADTAGMAVDERASLALVVLLKGLAAILLLTLLTATERFHRLLRALRLLRLPRLLGELSAFMYRYIFILTDEMHRTSLARASRTPGRLRVGRFRTLGNQAATVFVRGYDRSERVYRAMRARGFQGRFPQTVPLRFGPTDAIALILLVTAFLAVRIGI